MLLTVLALCLLPQQKAPDPDTAKYSALLEQHVANGRVDYEGLRKDRAALDEYLAAAAAARGEHGLAFWINVYNASVIRDLVDSGRKLPAKVTDLEGFFDARKHKVNGGEQTLNEIEGFVRKQWHDPRVHFALNCGALSCPPLLPRAFRDEKLGATLDELTRAFLDGPGIVLDESKKELRATKLLDWYKDDFVAKDGSLEAFLRQHVSDAKKLAALEPKSGWKLASQEYDWTPNARP
jgi:Protein of unknown function, DUF547